MTIKKAKAEWKRRAGKEKKEATGSHLPPLHLHAPRVLKRSHTSGGLEPEGGGGGQGRDNYAL
jgi:hypothetical protein